MLAIALAVGPFAATAARSADPAGDPAGAPRGAGGPHHSDRVLLGSLRTLARADRFSDARRAKLAEMITTGQPDHTQVAVTIRLDNGVDAPTLARLAESGARVVNIGSATVEAYVEPESLADLASLAEVQSVRAIPRRLPSYASLGVSLQGAPAWHSAGFTGAGVKVGIIDAGFTGLISRMGNELPASVQVQCYTTVGSFSADPTACENGETHGTAVAETVIDMAPGVELYLADPISQLDTVKTIEWMTASGVRIINASWSSGYLFDGPGDGISPHPDSNYALVDQAVAAGALWVNSAGNSGHAGWTGSWVDADIDGLLEWSSDDESNSLNLASGERVVLAIRWADPWGTASNDYDLELQQGLAVVASSQDRQAGLADPFEVLEYTAPAAGIYDIVIRRFAGAPTSRLQMLAYAGALANLEHQVVAGTLPSPADSANPGMVTIGAVNVASPSSIEPYSSQGPTLDGRIKPDLVAVDCAPTTVDPLFCGTSESAPFVTGAAALFLQADPGLTPIQLAERLRSRAIPLGAPVPNPTFGWGRLALGVAPPGPAVGLAFAAPPTGAVAGAALTGQPTVRLVASDGATASTGPSATAIVTLALTSSTGAALACDGGLSKPAVGGIAYFAGCTVDREGGSYTISASAPGLPTVLSAEFAIQPVGAPAPLAVAASAPTITWSADVILAATLGPGSAVPAGPAATGGARTVEFQRSSDGLRWTPIAQGTTDGAGLTSLSNRPATTLWYRAFFPGAPDLAAATSYPIKVIVRHRLTMAASVSAPRTVAVGRTVTFTSTVRPILAGSPPRPTVTFVVYRKVGGAWVLFRRVDVVADTAGRARLAWRFARAGTWYVRSMAKATTVNAASPWSPVAQYVVR